MTNTNKTGYVIFKKASEETFKLKKASFEEVSTLEFLQEAVGGYIEVVRLENDVVIWINEEGKLIGSKPNTALVDKNGNMLDVIYGDYVVTACDEKGETVPMTKEQVDYFQQLGKSPMVVMMGTDVLVLSTLFFGKL